MSVCTFPVHSVDDVRIYVSSSQQKLDRQLTMISHTIETIFGDNAILIPVPYPHTVKLHRLEQGEGLAFLRKLENAFDRGRYTPRISRPLFPSHSPEPHAPLGQYRVQFIGTKEEFQDYNNQSSIAHPRLVAQLLSLYSEPYWGFLVARIQEGYREYEPLVYSHTMVGTRFCIPTLHHYPETLKDVLIPEESDRWNHRIYINGTYREDDPRFQEVNPMRLNTIPWGVLPSGFDYALRDFVLKRKSGYGPNMDIQAESRIHAQAEGRRLGIEE